MSESVSPVGVRCSDADRERTSARLREAAAEGRLTMDELEDRLGAVYAAKHHRDLDALVTDLPAGNRRRAAAGWPAVLAAAWAQLRNDLSLLVVPAGAGWSRRRGAVAAVAALVLIATIASAAEGFDFEGVFDDD